MIIYSKPCTIDDFNMKTRGIGGGYSTPSNKTPKPIPKDKGNEFLKEDEFKI